NAAIDDPSATAASHAAHLIAAQGVARVHADTNNVAGLNRFRDDLLERFIDKDGIAGRLRGCCGENEQPSRCDDGRAKRIVAGVYKMNAHGRRPYSVRVWGPRASL